jgi:SnoaL-like domain
MKRAYAAFLLCVTPCVATPAAPVASFQSAMSSTDEIMGPPRGSAAEREAISRFENFLGHLDEKTAREDATKVYAPDAYLNDTLKTIHGSTGIRDYFIKTVQGLDGMTVTFDDMAVSGHNYYFRWTMDTRMKHLAKGQTVRTIGVTLVRFDPQGRVLIHQDFWDSAQGVWDHVPVLGSVIRWIQSKI